jgi:hypothetical protein
MKKSPNWTAKETALLQSDADTSEVARLLGRTVGAVRGRRQRMGLASPRAKLAAATFDEDKKVSNGLHWKSEYDALYAKYKKAVLAASVTDQLVDLAKDIAPTKYSARPSLVSKKKGSGSAQSAVLLLSDTHVGQIVSPDQTLGFGGYDFSTFLNRLQFLEDATTSILEDHTNTKLDELVICVGGDMIDGALQHGAEAKQKNTLFTQFYGAGHALAQFIRNIAPRVPKVRLHCVVGNHPRWGNQHKMPTENRYSNLDSFLYAYIQALTGDLRNVQWNLNKQPFSLFDVQGFKFHLSHGDHLKGGDKALGIPNHAVGRMVSSTTQLYGKHDLASPHYYLLGHMHRNIQLPHARGGVLVNGGFPGLDTYGLVSGFSPVDPTQLFFLVHPKFGKTATYDIQLKFGDHSNYKLPEDVDCV